VGDPFSLNNAANTGILYIKSTPLTIRFFRMWYEERELHPYNHDQDLFDKWLKYSPAVRESGLRFKFLSTEYFGGICEPSKDMNSVCSMHATCRIGLEYKRRCLIPMIDDWKKYLSLPPGEREFNPPSW
ncbi:hypothetical protein M569_14230, partial [Genlisea aurea]